MANIRSSSILPTVGILTMPDEQKNFRGNRKNFIDIIEAGKSYGVPVYVIAADQLHLNRERVLAYTYEREDNTWKPVWIALPQVIYNRIPFREDEQLPEINALIKECLKHPTIKLFNPKFFNKWELFRWLHRSRSTKNLIPYTRKFTKQTKLLPLLKRFPYLYFKPQSGKAGNGIMRLRRNRSSKLPYSLSIQESRRSQTFRFATLRETKQYLYSLIGDEAYIVQQGIKLARVSDRAFDLRVLVQKNHKGVWTVTGVGARQAGEMSITTHVPRGGSVEDPMRMLRATTTNTKAKRVMRRIKLTTLKIAKQIERNSGYSLGEMSMDLGLDAKGHLWFFEANSKPMKFDETDIREKSLKTMISYCVYLANSSKRKTRGGARAR